MNKDPLAEFVFAENEGQSLFLSVKKGDSIKLRVLTTDPVVSKDKYGNTRFAFIVWNYTDSKAQILNKGASIARPIQQLHLDEDYGANIQKIDIKLIANSTGPEDKDVEYILTPLPKAETLTVEQIKEAEKIKLDESIKNGTRMSLLNQGAKVQEQPVTQPKQDTPVSNEEVDSLLASGEPISLEDVPF